MRLRARLSFTVVAVLLVFAVTAFAAAWLRRAADQGHAQYTLGLMYYKGYGVAQEPKQAAVWFRRAADQGHAMAQFNLGVMYYDAPGKHDTLSSGGGQGPPQARGPYNAHHLSP